MSIDRFVKELAEHLNQVLPERVRLSAAGHTLLTHRLPDDEVFATVSLEHLASGEVTPEDYRDAAESVLGSVQDQVVNEIRAAWPAFLESYPPMGTPFAKLEGQTIRLGYAAPTGTLEISSLALPLAARGETAN